jgi:hypothetical protein
MVEYIDTRRPNRVIQDEYPARGLVSIGEAARITDTARRTMYDRVERGEVRSVVASDGQRMIPLSEVRDILEEGF